VERCSLPIEQSSSVESLKYRLFLLRTDFIFYFYRSFANTRSCFSLLSSAAAATPSEIHTLAQSMLTFNDFLQCFPCDLGQREDPSLRLCYKESCHLIRHCLIDRPEISEAISSQVCTKSSSLMSSSSVDLPVRQVESPRYLPFNAFSPPVTTLTFSSPWTMVLSAKKTRSALKREHLSR
jgi:hypothetical protein